MIHTANARRHPLDSQPQSASLDVLHSTADSFQAGVALASQVHHVPHIDWVAAAVRGGDVACTVQLALDVLQRGCAYVWHLWCELQEEQAMCLGV